MKTIISIPLLLLSQSLTLAAPTDSWNLGIFGTGIYAEADWDYARLHAESLIQGRPIAYLYVAFEGMHQPAGVPKMQQLGVQTVTIPVVSPYNSAPIESFIKESIAQGKNPVVFFDVNKVIPHQFGNSKPAAEILPARIAVAANEVFHHAVAQANGHAQTTMAGHSDFTWAVAPASKFATAAGHPFDRVIFESPRSEAAVKEAVSASPTTQFRVVMPANGDFFTIEAQTRVAAALGALGNGLVPGNVPDVQGARSAYQKTIEVFKGIGGRNYGLLLIDNPSPTTVFGLPTIHHNAHSDPAEYGRHSEITLWNGGTQIGSQKGPLGEAVNQFSQPFAVSTFKGQSGGSGGSPAQPVKGVSMQTEISGDQFDNSRAQELEAFRNRSRQARPSADSLSWPAPTALDAKTNQSSPKQNPEKTKSPP